MRVSNKTAEDLMSQVSALLCRMLYFPKMPLTSQYWWQRGMPPGYIEAIRTIEADTCPYGIFSKYYEVHLPVQVSNTEMYSVRLRQSTGGGFVLYSPSAPIPANHLAANAEEFHQFVSWIRNCDTAYTQVADAYTTLKQVLEMVTTVGQLKRMVPDLMRYLPTQAREVVANQRRRSSMPGGWMSVDRPSLRAAVDLVAKCYLLPEPEVDNPSVDRLSTLNWAFKAHTGADNFRKSEMWNHEPEKPWNKK